MNEPPPSRPQPWRIEVSLRPDYDDPEGREVEAEVRSAGLPPVTGIRCSRIYLLDGHLTRQEAMTIAEELLTDPVSEFFSMGDPLHGPDMTLVTVTRWPRVMDPVTASLRKAVSDLGITVEQARTARRYYFPPSTDVGTLEPFARRVLSNPIVEEVYIGDVPIDLPEEGAISAEAGAHGTVPIGSLSGEDLADLSERSGYALSRVEMRAIQDHFEKAGREPTDVEMETIAQTWSEHCKHKTLKGLIRYEGREIDDLLDQTVMKATRELARPWCLSVFADNAGVVCFDGETAIAAKVETHNHPSAIEPYGGAGTGIGGVIRDILGCGLGAWPVLNTDVFCFGEPDTAPMAVPEGVIHPRQVMKGVVSGVRDYGNRMGIPTASGGIFFHPSYTRNPLVYCGTIGVMSPDHVNKSVEPGDVILVVGGRTGRDGIHGVTFASEELHEEVDRGAVQIGNPITEKKALDTIIQARDEGLYRAITDCGGGGLSSAVGEMGAETGVEVDLEKVPLKYGGLRAAEIWISEAQERMVVAVPPENLERILEIFEAEEVEATPIGRFTDSGRLQIRYAGEVVGDLDLQFLHKGVPRPVRRATWSPPQTREPERTEKESFSEDILKILSAWNVCSREWVIRQYDHEVQGGMAQKPLQGDDGPGDATVVTPVLGKMSGFAVSHGLNPFYGELDPYDMAVLAIDEAVRNVVAVGADPEKIAILDNFCWGNTENADRLGGLVRAAKGCHDAALALGTPFISGKDSLNNEYREGEESFPVTPTLLITAVGHVPDVTRTVSMDLKSPQDRILLVGQTANDLGGSHYYRLLEEKGIRAPRLHPAEARDLYRAVHEMIRGGLVRACHDLSEGGIAIAAAEMAMGGSLGIDISLRDVPIREGMDYDFMILFSETPSRFLLEVPEETLGEVRSILGQIPFAPIGKVSEDDRIRITGRLGQEMVNIQVHQARRAWKEPLYRVFGEEG